MFLQDFSVGQSGRVSTRNHAKPSYEIYGFPVPSGKLTMPFIVDLPIENGGSFHSYVKVYQRVTNPFNQAIDLGIMISKGNHRQMAELFRLVKYEKNYPGRSSAMDCEEHLLRTT